MIDGPGGAQFRDNISGEVARVLRDMIFDGELRGGERINEVALAERLGVSRTPLREALGMLTAEEAVVSVPRKGCFVKEVTREEFEAIYPIRRILEPEALMLAGIPTPEQLDQLEEMNERVLSAESIRERMTADEAWHLQLVAGCGNPVLLDLIRHFMNRFRRYGLAFARESSVIEAANHEHIEILKSLRAGDLQEACRWFRQNLSSSKQPILEWLHEREDRIEVEAQASA